MKNFLHGRGHAFRWMAWLLPFPVLFLILNALFPFHISISYSRIVLAGDGTVIQAFLSADEKWRMPVTLNEISPELKKAILFKEDKYFYFHPGINPVSVMRAAWNNIRSGRRTSGASTITMQVVRLLNPRKRTYPGKIIEMFRALQMEWKFSKDEILRMYLNLVPYGGNIEGITSAGILYFGRLPDQLSLAQVTTLSVIPNRPGSLRPGGNRETLKIARNRWLMKMQEDQIFPDQEIADAMAEPATLTRIPFVPIAPHLSVRLKENRPGNSIQTFINPVLQKKTANLAANYCKRLQVSGISNVSVIVVDNRTHRVVAYEGSGDFNDSEHEGQVDGVRAVRSPGSTLKPLVYGIAFDKGLLTPKSILEDVPVNYDGYSPENYDSRFTGTVSVESALMNSRNIPAVNTLKLIGLECMKENMGEAGFEQVLHTKSDLGLSLILGGCGVRLEELTALYGAFANMGEYYPLQFTVSDTLKKGFRLLSAPAAYMVTDILARPVRQEAGGGVRGDVAHLPKIAWKTGTSYGRRDAWSIGYNRNYTIGVWVGNFNGQGIPELTGAEKASPLLFELFNAIDRDARSDWFTVPDGLDFRLVCPLSGMPPGDFCNNTVIDFFIPGVSRNTTCSHLTEVAVSADGRHSYCTACIPSSGYKREWFPNLSPELISFYESEHIPWEKRPPHNPFCSRIFTSGNPEIISLLNGKTYLVEKGEGRELMLSCNSAGNAEKIYWYINDRFFKQAERGEQVFFSPDPGKVKISCSDDKGRNSDITIHVQLF